MGNITFGWFLPTFGDTTSFGDPNARIPAGNALFDDVTKAVDEGGFQYLLMPVAPTCWEATAVGAYYAARTRNLAPLIAIRAGYVNPVQSAKMLATLDQLTQGRVAINLIAGISDADCRADGIFDEKPVRYARMDEEVQIMKRLWSSQTPIGFDGDYYKIDQVVEPKPFQSPHPPFFLGGGSAEAEAVSARHATVHLFWGETPASIGDAIARIRKQAAAHGRQGEIGFGMRMHVICRPSEDEAWEAAAQLIAGAPKLENVQDLKWGKDGISDIAKTSEANRKVWALLEQSGEDMRVHPHLWTGIASVRMGAGIAVVGTPAQVAATLDEYVAAGCTSFCLSGYPHARAAESFGREVIAPYFRDRLARGLPGVRQAA